MGYGTTQNGSSRRRMTILTSVAVLHAGVFYVLVTGLAGVVTMIEPPRNLTAHDDPTIVPITPPTPQPTRKPQDPITPSHRDPVPRTLSELELPPIPLPSPTPIGAGMAQGLGDETAQPVPTPSPTPRFVPHVAVPRGARDTWLSSNDYPAQDLREGNAGVTGFRLTIGRDGRPQSCTITASSGHPRLDAATCQLVLRRATFKPATDDTGAATPGSYQSRVAWTIPER